MGEPVGAKEFVGWAVGKAVGWTVGVCVGVDVGDSEPEQTRL